MNVLLFIKSYRKTSYILLVIAILSLIVAIGIVLSNFLKPYNAERIFESRYQTAKQLLEEKQYSQSTQIFHELGDYKDSAEFVLESRYQTAKQFLREKQYSESAQIFHELGDYKDSAECFSESRYQTAKQLLEEKQYSESAQIFHELGDYEDSKSLMQHSLFQSMQDSQERIFAEASRLMNNAQYIDAIDLFEKLVSSNYEPARKKAEECRQWLDLLLSTFSAGSMHSTAITNQGTIVAISAGFGFTLALREDGTLLSCGYHYQHQRPKSEGDTWTKRDMWADIALHRWM